MIDNLDLQKMIFDTFIDGFKRQEFIKINSSEDMQINQNKNYWLFPKLKRISPGLINMPEDPKIMPKQNAKFDQISNAMIPISLPKYAICKKCGYKNEYMDFDPNYICFNCR